MIFSFSLALISFAGMAVMVGRRIREARLAGTDNELPLSHFYHLSREKIIYFWKNIFLPHFFQSAERIVSKSRDLVRELEKSLSKLDARISGRYKKIESSNGNGNGSKYWNDVIEFKNGLNDEDKNDKNLPA